MYYLFRYLMRLWRERRGGPAVAAVAEPAVAEAGIAAPALREPAVGVAAVGEAPPRSAPARRPARSDTGPSAAARGPLALLVHQVSYDLRTSLRNPRARFFTFFFPILLLVVFNGVFGSGTTVLAGEHVKLSRFYVPGILTMSIVVAAYAGLVISIATNRESGVLKRRRATPVPPGLLIAGQALSTVVVTMIMSAILLIIAKLAYGVGFAPGALAAAALVILIGTISFACIGYAVSGLIGSPEAAQPIVQATMFPLWFISGVFIPVPNLSSTLRSIGRLFPVAHLSNSLGLAAVHGSFGGAISVGDLLVLGAWALGAAVFAALRFSWLPTTATA